MYNIFVPENWPTTSTFWLPYRRHSSSTDCARELFKPSKDLASLLMKKKCFWLGVTDLSEVFLGHFGSCYLA